MKSSPTRKHIHHSESAQKVSSLFIESVRLIFFCLIGTPSMRRHQRKHIYPFIWVLIFGLAIADGQTDNTENYEILTEMDSNGEIKTNSTDVEISGDEIDYEYGEAYESFPIESSYSAYDDNYLFEEYDVAFEVSTIFPLALGASILLNVGTIGAGYCISKRPLRSETRSSMGLSLSEPRTEGVISENQPLFDAVYVDNPVQNQNNAGATSVQQV